MKERPQLAVVAVAVLVMVAGCPGPLASDDPATETGPETTETPAPAPAQTDATTAPTDDGTVTESPTDAVDGSDGAAEREGVVVENGSVPVNTTEVHQRVERLMGVEGIPPTVELQGRNLSENRIFGISGADIRDRCGPMLPLTSSSFDPSNMTAEELELALASTAAASLSDDIQMAQPDPLDLFRRNGSSFNLSLNQYLSLGSSLYVTNEYAEEYDKRIAGKRPMELYECLLDRFPPVLGAPYAYFGAQYMEQRLDGPSQLERIYETPPTTSEQLLHGETPTSEPPAPLRVNVSDSPSVSVEDRTRRGELVVRNWLRYGPSSNLSEIVPRDRASEAARGWGNDETIRFKTEEGSLLNHAWALRWDAPGEADEFESALDVVSREYSEVRDYAVRRVRVSPETVVVFYGDASFVANATASGTNGNVTVTPP